MKELQNYQADLPHGFSKAVNHCFTQQFQILREDVSEAET